MDESAGMDVGDYYNISNCTDAEVIWLRTGREPSEPQRNNRRHDIRQNRNDLRKKYLYRRYFSVSIGLDRGLE